MSDEETELAPGEGTYIDGIYIPAPAKPLETLKNTSRLIITKISNKFFKSYANEQILGPFHKCFNAIVGPNGSGKSNVIDSMLFVFGYRATKIRSKNISVLLHNSDQYKNVQSCTVAVHFCEAIDKPGDEYEIIPGSEFVVARTANKDNSSYYHLNDRRVQFKEVAQLLRKHGIDLDHNRFLILQGEVEEIAMMKCKASNENETGMLEYLEDVIGTKRYKKPLVQLEERVEILSEDRTEKLNRLKLVEKQLASLKPALDEAVEFLKAENEVTKCKNVIYQHTIRELEDQSKDFVNEVEKVGETHEKLMEQLSEVVAKKKEQQKVLSEASNEYEQLENRKEKLKQAFNAADKKDVQLRADMDQLNKKRKNCMENVKNEMKRLENLETVPEKNEASIAECEAKEKELISKKEELEERKTRLLATLRAETQELQKEKEVLQTELGKLVPGVNETKSAFELAEKELELYSSAEESERKTFEDLQAKYNESGEIIQKRAADVSLLSKKIPATEKSLRKALDELKDSKRTESELVLEMNGKRRQLEESRSSMQASKSRGKIIDALMKQKREGHCQDLWGRLGDLGAIDEKFDIAVSTACGPLDNIVVDTVETAQWCIEYLKKHNIGRVTIIVLEKQEHLREKANTRIQTPENVHRLYDLIKVADEAVKTAFYFGLRDTLVANDLDQATRIAYGQQRFRVVTLRGDLIEMTGTMSGGGKSVSRGRMGQSVVAVNVDPREVKRMESQLQKLEEQLGNVRYEQTKFEDQVRTLEPELRQMKIDYEKFTKELQALKTQQPILAEQLKAQKAKSDATKADPAQVKKLQAVVNQKKADYEKASESVKELRSQVDSLTKEIKDKTSGKMKALQKNLNETTSTLDKCKKEITRLRVAIKASERDTKKCKENIATLEKDIKAAEDGMREMNSQRNEIEKDAEQLLKCIAEIDEKMVSDEGEFSDLKKEVAKLTNEENKLKSEKVDVDEALKTAKRKLNDCKASIHQWHAKLSHLKLQDIPEETGEELQTFTAEELSEKNLKVVKLDLERAENLLKSTKPNLKVIEEHRNCMEMYTKRSQELEVVTNKRNEIKDAYEKVKNQRKDEFIAGYNIVKLKLKEMYQMITLGGDADFEIVDSFDPFSEGIQFNVRPPKKSWKNISNLSGGEKTLSSLALVFALHYYKPSPLYVMDEIDAALDFKNVSIVGHYIKERTKNAQFIIISLRSNMFELCDYLIGIYKTFNCTKTITIDPRVYDKKPEEGNKENSPGQKLQQTQSKSVTENAVNQLESASMQASQESQENIDSNEEMDMSLVEGTISTEGSGSTPMEIEDSFETSIVE